MRQRPRDARQKQSGFTLIELLIVIVILGVLAAVVLLAVGAFEDRGQQAACRSDVKVVEKALEAYRAKEGTFPASLEDLTGGPENYLREVPNTTENSGDYWIEYEPATGTVEGFVNVEGDDDPSCAGGLALPTPNPSASPSATTSTEPGGGGPGGGGPGGGSPTTTTSAPGGGNPTTTTTTSAPGGGNPTTTTTTSPGGGNPTTTTPNPNPTPGTPATPTANCTNPPGGDDWDCTLSWPVPSGTVTGYDWQLVYDLIGQCRTADFETFLPPVVNGHATTNSVMFDERFPGAYCFRVRAENGNIHGPWSNPVRFYWPL